jgi:hypothetical protein
MDISVEIARVPRGQGVRPAKGPAKKGPAQPLGGCAGKSWSRQIGKRVTVPGRPARDPGIAARPSERGGRAARTRGRAHTRGRTAPGATRGPNSSGGWKRRGRTAANLSLPTRFARNRFTRDHKNFWTANLAVGVATAGRGDGRGVTARTCAGRAVSAARGCPGRCVKPGGRLWSSAPARARFSRTRWTGHVARVRAAPASPRRIRPAAEPRQDHDR